MSVLDLTTVDAALKGFRGGFTDGTYGYLVPNYVGKFGRVGVSPFAFNATTSRGFASSP